MKRKVYMVGYYAEHRAVLDLKEQGYLVVRAGGSKGPIDLVAVDRQKIRLIQIKSTHEEKAPSYKKEIEKLKLIKKPDNCLIELWIWKTNYGWSFIPVS